MAPGGRRQLDSERRPAAARAAALAAAPLLVTTFLGTVGSPPRGRTRFSFGLQLAHAPAALPGSGRLQQQLGSAAAALAVTPDAPGKAGALSCASLLWVPQPPQVRPLGQPYSPLGRRPPSPPFRANPDKKQSAWTVGPKAAA